MTWQLRERWQAIQAFVRRLLGMPAFLVETMREFVKAGAVTIHTDFEYSPTTGVGDEASGPVQLGFRTCVQLDGDVLNMIPPPDLYAHDPAWADTLETQWAMHQAKVEQFFRDLQVFQLFGRGVASVTGAIVGVVTAFGSGLEQIGVAEWPLWANVLLVLAVFIVVSYGMALLFRYLLRPLLIMVVRHYLVAKLGR